jgi:hypothetical protein
MSHFQGLGGSGRHQLSTHLSTGFVDKILTEPSENPDSGKNGLAQPIFCCS